MRSLVAAVLCGLAVLTLTPFASAAIRITKIYYKSPGADSGSNASLNGEWIAVRNTGSRARQLKGWKIRDIEGHIFRFLSFKLPAKTTVKIHSGNGPDTFPRHLYWKLNVYVWDNDTDKATLRNAAGGVVDTCSYDNATVAYKVC
jgi:hypothetical protein